MQPPLWGPPSVGAALLSPATEQVPVPAPPHAHGSRRSPGIPVAERVFMLSPGTDISVDQSNISQVFSTGYWNALIWL